MSLAETQHFCPWTGKVGKHALPIRASASMCFPNLLVAFCSLFTNSTHTHTRLDIMQGNIYWYSWPISPPPIKLVCTLTHSSQRFLPPLFCDYTERPGSSRQRWDAHRSTISEQKLRELWQPPRNPGERFSEMCHTAFPVCHEYRPCVLLRETATVTTQICPHLCINANISHSLAAPLTTIQLDFLP